jgi:hypothetical protein
MAVAAVLALTDSAADVVVVTTVKAKEAVTSVAAVSIVEALVF